MYVVEHHFQRAMPSIMSSYPHDESYPDDGIDKATEWPILLCLFGRFQVLKGGCRASVHGAKAEALLCSLALQPNYLLERTVLLDILWPDCDPMLASKSLHTLVHNLRKLLSDAIDGAAPVVYSDGQYRLNIEAGIGLDTARFQELVSLGNWQAQAQNELLTVAAYSHAIRLYGGDLCRDLDIHAIGVRAVIERERLRTLYQGLLRWLIEYHFLRSDYLSCLENALLVIANDPCCEDAHRMIMRCHLQLGNRSRALHHFRLCQELLRAEFDATPEPATLELYEQVRRDPGTLRFPQ